jgi:hypothetical protein
VLIENDGADAVAGTFGGLPEGATFLETGMRWRVTYTGGDGNDVAVTLVEIPPPVLTSIRVTPGTGAQEGFFVIEIVGRGVASRQHDLEISTDLLNWVRLLVVVGNASTGAIAVTVLRSQGIERAFFRVRPR